MKNVRILIVEDNFSHAIKLEMMLESLGYLHIDKAENSEQAFKNIANHRPDLILMDIQLKGELSGIDIAAKIKDKNIPIIYLTAFLDNESFEKAKKTLPYAYLNKPFDETTLKRTIELAIAHYAASAVHQSTTKNEEKSIFIRQAGKIKKVEFTSILWIKADGNYCYLYTSEKKFVLKISLVRMMKKIPANMFIRTHRNILVQINKVQQVDLVENKITLNNELFPIGSTFRKDVLKQFKS